MVFKCPDLDEEELGVVERIDEMRQSLQWSVVREPRRWTGSLRRVLFAKGIQSSNSIEGINVTLEDALAAIEGEDPLDADKATWLDVRGYRTAMTYVLRLANDPYFSYSTDLIRSLHFMMLNHDLSKHPGTYRPGYIYIRTSNTGEIVYEGPDAELVSGLMTSLAVNLNLTDDKPAIIRAAMAHLNLVLIHPFKDGNGRMARCLQTLVLAREGILEPAFASIEEYLGRNTSDYYRVLAEVGGGYWQPKNNARPWIRFCLVAHYRQVRTLQIRMRESEKLWELLSAEIDKRKLPLRAVYALFDAGLGYRVRRATYQPFAEISDQLATRDLKQMVDADMLIPHGEKRGRFYVASDRLKEIAGKAREVRLPVEDPFEESTQRLPHRI